MKPLIYSTNIDEAHSVGSPALKVLTSSRKETKIILKNVAKAVNCKVP